MSFFYDLNKKLDSIRATPEVTHQQLNERDMSRAAKGYEKYGKQGMEALAKAGREGKALDPVRKKYDKYDEGQDFGPGRSGPNKNLPGPEYSFSPDTKNYKTPHSDAEVAASQSLDKTMGKGYSVKNFPTADVGAAARDARGQTKYVDRTAPGVINKIKDKLGYDMPDPAYGPRPDETQRLAKRYPAPTKESGGPAVQAKPSKPATQAPAKPSKPAPKGEFMGTIKGGVWTADPPKRGERGVPAPSGDPEGVKEAGKKLNFADKIANAKKEVDEMLGDVAAEAMRSALSPKQKKIDMNKNGKLDANDFAMLRKGAKPEMDEERSKGTAFDMSTSRASTPKVGSTERGAKHDIKHTATGRMVTRRTDDQGISVGSETDDEGNKKEKRTKAGRPDGSGKKIGAKGPSGKSKLMTKEGEDDPAEKGEYDREGDMALDDIDTIESAANELQSIIDAEDNLPEWVQSKINKAMDYLDTARDYMAAQGNDQEPIAEEPRSKNQAVAARIARGVQKGTAKAKPGSASSEMAKMQPKELNKFAKGSTKGLPKKVSKNKEEVDETSEEGRITTTRTGPGKTLTTSSTGRVSATISNGKMSVKPGKQDKPMDADTDTASNKDTSSSKSNSMVGKGIYDSMNRELELMIAESMSINMSDSTEGGKSLTITATDEDALKLGMLLKNAGLGGGDQHGGDMHSPDEQPCATCGMPDCGCGDVQEAVDDNAPDYPTNTEQADNNFGYAGGLNKPKADVAGNGQSTVPVVATRPHNDDDLRRMMEMAGLAEAAKPDFLDINKNGDKEESMKDAADDKEEDTVEESIQRMREMAGIKEAKKEVDEEKTDEGNKFAFNVLKAKAAGKKEADLDGDGDMEKVRESIFALNNQWKAYKG